jgi:hypothetical protein
MSRDLIKTESTGQPLTIGVKTDLPSARRIQAALRSEPDQQTDFVFAPLSDLMKEDRFFRISP